MRIEPVDERDSGWEDLAPRFRVYVFEEQGVRIAGDGSRSPGYMTSTWDITEADLLDVVRWAQMRAGAEGLYSVALVADRYAYHADRGLVWLVGMDYQDTPMNDRERTVQAAMLARRGRETVNAT